VNDLLIPSCCCDLGFGFDPSVMEPFNFENKPLFFGLFTSVELWVMLPIFCLGAILFSIVYLFCVQLKSVFFFVSSPLRLV